MDTSERFLIQGLNYKPTKEIVHLGKTWELDHFSFGSPVYKEKKMTHTVTCPLNQIHMIMEILDPTTTPVYVPGEKLTEFWNREGPFKGIPKKSVTQEKKGQVKIKLPDSFKWPEREIIADIIESYKPEYQSQIKHLLQVNNIYQEFN